MSPEQQQEEEEEEEGEEEVWFQLRWTLLLELLYR